MRDIEGRLAWRRKHPIDWTAVKRILRYRQAKRRMERTGYSHRELIHLQVMGEHKKHVTDVIISEDGYGVWYRIEPRP